MLPKKIQVQKAQHIPLSKMQAERIADELTIREGSKYKFFCFMNLARLSLVFTSEGSRQLVLTIDHAQEMLKDINNKKECLA